MTIVDKYDLPEAPSTVLGCSWLDRGAAAASALSSWTLTNIKQSQLKHSVNWRQIQYQSLHKTNSAAKDNNHCSLLLFSVKINCRDMQLTNQNTILKQKLLKYSLTL